MFFVLELPLFAILCLFSFYIPGELFLSALKVNLSKAERFIIPWFLGVSLFLIINYLFAWVNLPFAYLYILVLLNLIFFYRLLKNPPKLSFGRIDYWSLLITILGSLAFSFSMFFSGTLTKDGLQFIGTNAADGIRHIAYIKNMLIFFPPQEPGFSGVALKGFHYFYDFMLSRFGLFYRLDVGDLYFRLFPFLLSLLYGGAFYLVVKRFVKNVVASRLVLFFAYFSRSFAFPAMLFLSGIQLTDSAIVQPMGLMVNPFIVLGIAMLVVGIAFLPDIKKNYKYAIIVALVLGPLAQIKVYAGIIGIFVVSFYALYLFLRYKIKYLFSSLVAVILVAILTAITFLPNNFKQGSLLFYPLEFYRHYLAGSNIANLNWDLQRVNLLAMHDYFKVAILYVGAIIFFWILNLGLRIIIIFKTGEMFRKSFWLNDYNFIFVVALMTPILLGSLFIQSVSVFDTVQFFWIILAILAVPSGIVFGEIFNKMGKLKYLLIVLLIFFSVPGNLAYLSGYLPNQNSTVISNLDLKVYSKIQQTVKGKDLLVYISKKDKITQSFHQSVSPVVSAMTGRPVYLNYGNLPLPDAQNLYTARAQDMINLDKHLTKCDLADIKNEFKRMGTNYFLTRNKYECLGRPYVATKIINSGDLSFYLIKE